MLLSLIIVSTALVGENVWLLLKDTLNRIQYVEFLRVYWITRDTGGPGTPLVQRSFMKQTSPPFWAGKGLQFRLPMNRTFQVGILLGKVVDLSEQLGSGFLDTPAKTIRDWGKNESA